MSDIAIPSPIRGWVVPLDAVPDPVFAERMLGDGVAIEPLDGIVRAPIAGRIAVLHPACHAVTIEGDDGLVLLIHVGLETVALAGRGFTAHVGEGQRVAAGDAVLTVDLDTVGEAAKSLVTPIVLTNGELFELLPPATGRLVAAGEPLLALRRRDAAAAEAPIDEASIERALILPLRHGLHARPAARIAATMRGFDARVSLVTADGRTAPATSPVAMLALALPHGAVLRLVGSGPHAPAAVAALAELIEGGMGEGAPVAPEPPAAAEAEIERPSLLRGVTAAPGSAVAPAYRWRDATIAVPPSGAGIDVEHAALAAGLKRLREEMMETRRQGTSAEIVAAHLAFLSDPGLLDQAEQAVEAGASAGLAWRQATDHFAHLLGQSGDSRFVERIADLRDLERRLLMLLYGDAAAPMIPHGVVILADEVLPSQVMALADLGIAGIATARGGPTSHAAIIAASHGLPMLAALGEGLAAIADGTMLLLDGEAGTLSIDPPADQLAERARAGAKAKAFRIEAEGRAHEPAVTRDGAPIEVFANLGSVNEARAAFAAGAEGCGLLRTEFLFLDRATPPDEEEQRLAYQAIADALQGRPLIVRTMDIGADKPAPYLPMPGEENPALGLRGVRLSLARPGLLRSQLRALVRVEGVVRIMLPMVIEPAEVHEVNTLLAELAAEAGRAVPELGIMVETPAAAMLAGQLCNEARFFSVGSNDLSQYVLAMDRGNPAVAQRLDGLHPAVLRMIDLTVRGGQTGGAWTGVCGGIAADPLAVPLLIGMGVSELSVPVSALAETKERVRRLDRVACRTLAAEALDLRSAAAVRARVRAHLEGGAA